MNKIYLFLLVTTLFLSSCATKQEVLPSQRYENSYINVNSPNTRGWRLSQGKWGMMFGKKDEKGASYIITMLHYALPKRITDSKFLKMVKKTNVKNKEWFQMIESSSKLSIFQGYTCVKIEQLIKDNEAHISSTDTRILLLRISSLYCKIPKKNIVLVISYSYRGKKIPNTFKTDAKYFLNGVKIKK